MSRKQELEQIVTQGFQLLEEKLAYKQVNIVNKLNAIEHGVSTAALNKFLNHGDAGKGVLHRMAKGIQMIIESELGHQYNTEQQSYIFAPPVENWQPMLIMEKDIKITPDVKKVIFHTDGRLPIQQKVEFMLQAQKEIIEVGVRLHTFTEYFTSRSENEFAVHIEALLQRGVNIKLYLLDPESNEARLYFQDRGKVQRGKLLAIESMRTVIQQLKDIKNDSEKKKLRGQFDIFAYKHIPYNHFLITDGDTDYSRMMLSHYIYGVNRANCPVIEFSKAADSNLYRRYWDSLQYYIADAKKLI